MRIGIRAEVAVQLFVLFDDDQNGYLASRLSRPGLISTERESYKELYGSRKG